MKAILLAGGRGTRISRFVGEMPKSLLDINGQPLIKKTISMLLRKNIDVIVVTGYKKELFEEALKDFQVKFYYNPFFDITNSIASLWFAKEELNGEDLIIANADVFWEEEILDLILKDKNEQVLLMDSSRGQDYLFKVKNDVLLEYGKDLTDFSGEYVGIAKIKSTFIEQFKTQLLFLINTQKHNLWWENTLYSLNNKTDIIVKDIKGLFWSEIDYIEDYERILNYIINVK